MPTYVFFNTLIDIIRAAKPAECRLILAAHLGDSASAERLMEGGGGKFEPVLIGPDEDRHLLDLLTGSDPAVARFTLAALFDASARAEEEAPRQRTAATPANWLWSLPTNLRRWIQQRPFAAPFSEFGRELGEYASDPARVQRGDLARLESIFGPAMQDPRSNTLVGRHLRQSAGLPNYQGAFEKLPEMYNLKTGRWDLIQKFVNWFARAGGNLDDFPIHGLGSRPMTLGQLRRIGASGGQLQVTDSAAFQASVQAIGETINRQIGNSAGAKMWGNIIKGTLMALLAGKGAQIARTNTNLMVPQESDQFTPEGKPSYHLDEEAWGAAPIAPAAGGGYAPAAGSPPAAAPPSGATTSSRYPMGPEWRSPGTDRMMAATPHSMPSAPTVDPKGGYGQGYGNLGQTRPVAPPPPQGYGDHGQGAGSLGGYTPPAAPEYNWRNINPASLGSAARVSPTATGSPAHQVPYGAGAIVIGPPVAPLATPTEEAILGPSVAEFAPEKGAEEAESVMADPPAQDLRNLGTWPLREDHHGGAILAGRPKAAELARYARVMDARGQHEAADRADLLLSRLGGA